MDFMEEIALYNLAMDNAYALIVGDLKLDEMMIELDHEGDEYDYTGLEEYEKCARLVKAKNSDS